MSETTYEFKDVKSYFLTTWTDHYEPYTIQGYTFTMNTLKKSPALALSIIVTCLTLCSQPVYSKLLDKVVAVVNDDIITKTELEAETDQFIQRIVQSTPPAQVAATIAKVRSEILQRVIEERLIRQLAQQKKISVSADEFNAAYQNLLNGNNMTVEQFAAELKKNGLTLQQHKEMFRNQMLQAKLVSFEIRSKIVVTEAMIIDYYDREFAPKTDGTAYSLLQIGITWNQGEKSEALIQAENVRKMAVNDEDFASLAKKFSDLPSSDDGGDIGTFTTDEMSDEMREVIAPLKKNEISEIIETEFGFQFFKVTAITENNVTTKTPYESVKEEIREILYERQFKNDYNNWIKQLRENAYIEVL